MNQFTATETIGTLRLDFWDEDQQRPVSIDQAVTALERHLPQ